MNMRKSWLWLGIALLSVSAHARWQWIDKDGRKVFSDSAPPPEVPTKNILKRPGAPAVALPVSAASAASAPSNPAAVAARAAASPASRAMSPAERELIERKKQAETAQEAARKASDAALDGRRAAACEGVRNSVAHINSGQRIVRTNAKGEREFLDEGAVAAERQRLQGILDQDCRPR